MLCTCPSPAFAFAVLVFCCLLAFLAWLYWECVHSKRKPQRKRPAPAATTYTVPVSLRAEDESSTPQYRADADGAPPRGVAVLESVDVRMAADGEAPAQPPAASRYGHGSRPCNMCQAALPSLLLHRVFTCPSVSVAAFRCCRWPFLICCSRPWHCLLKPGWLRSICSCTCRSGVLVVVPSSMLVPPSLPHHQPSVQHQDATAEEDAASFVTARESVYGTARASSTTPSFVTAQDRSRSSEAGSGQSSSYASQLWRSMWSRHRLGL